METQKIKINEKEKKVLEFLAQEWSSDMNCYYFRGIASTTKLTIKEVRRVCRSLARKGLTMYVRGLMDDDGMVAGSGYCATRKGASMMSPCDVCGDLAMYEYDGKLECENHYKQSTK